ncbi:MAG: zf-HC2 domain-containing protein [Bacteroidales bacterium]|nr:zf-HC2 domain-containing protein [Bacteroidales bacterium]
MTCKNVEHKIADYIESSLSDKEKLAFEKHLLSCDSCKHKVEFFEKTFDCIENEKQIKVNSFLETRILAKIEATNNNKSIYKKVLQPVFVAVMLGLVVWFGNILSDVYLNVSTQVAYSQDTSVIDKTVQFAINDITYEDYYFINSQ